MKNLLKSIFISVFPAFALYVLIDSILHLLQHDFNFHYLSRIVIALTIAVFFVGLFIKPRARTSRNLNIYMLLIVIGLLISIYGRFVDANSNNNFIDTLLIFGWVFYISWFSVFKNRNKNILKVGNILPNFQLEDSKNPDSYRDKVSSETFLGNPSIYLFYRGNWCPLCMAQIKEIASQYKELEKRGVNMIFISPQPHKFSKTLADKFQLNFNFLTDVNNTVAKQLGVFSKNGIPAGFQVLGYHSDTVLPTVVITDANGKIVFADLTDNYRVRPEPETFLKVIDSLL